MWKGLDQGTNDSPSLRPAAVPIKSGRTAAPLFPQALQTNRASGSALARSASMYVRELSMSARKCPAIISWCRRSFRRSTTKPSARRATASNSGIDGTAWAEGCYPSVGLRARLTIPDMRADVAAAIHLQNAAAIHMQNGGSYHNTKKSQKLWLRIARGK